MKKNILFFGALVGALVGFLFGRKQETGCVLCRFGGIGQCQ